MRIINFYWNVVLAVSLLGEGFHLIWSGYHPANLLNKDWGIALGIFLMILCPVGFIFDHIVPWGMPAKKQDHPKP
jgi:hypothetical protein